MLALWRWLMVMMGRDHYSMESKPWMRWQANCPHCRDCRKGYDWYYWNQHRITKREAALADWHQKYGKGGA